MLGCATTSREQRGWSGAQRPAAAAAGRRHGAGRRWRAAAGRSRAEPELRGVHAPLRTDAGGSDHDADLLPEVAARRAVRATSTSLPLRRVWGPEWPPLWAGAAVRRAKGGRRWCGRGVGGRRRWAEPRAGLRIGRMKEAATGFSEDVWLINRYWVKVLGFCYLSRSVVSDSFRVCFDCSLLSFYSVRRGFFKQRMLEVGCRTPPRFC